MQATGYTPAKARANEVGQVIVAIILFGLLMGFWACLWVRLPIF